MKKKVIALVLLIASMLSIVSSCGKAPSDEQIQALKDKFLRKQTQLDDSIQIWLPVMIETDRYNEDRSVSEWKRFPITPNELADYPNCVDDETAAALRVIWDFGIVMILHYEFRGAVGFWLDKGMPSFQFIYVYDPEKYATSRIKEEQIAENWYFEHEVAPM